MRFLVCVMALAMLGCAFGPSAEAPPPAPAPVAPSALSQALGGMGVVDERAPGAAAVQDPQAGTAAAPPAPAEVAAGTVAAGTVPAEAVPAEVVAAPPSAPATPAPPVSAAALAAAPPPSDAVTPGGFGAPADAPTSGGGAATAGAAAAAAPASPACVEATSARDAVRARLADLRLTLGAQTSARLEAAGQAMMACNNDSECLRDAKARMARIDAYDRAKAAHEAERTRLAQAEVGLYEADRAVAAACGTP